MIPYTIVNAGISKLNSQEEFKKILKIGLIRLIVLLALISTLTQTYGLLGVAIEIIINTSNNYGGHSSHKMVVTYK